MNDDRQQDNPAEQVFDYFLQELVTGQTPPDLWDRISAAWGQEQGGKAPAAPSAEHTLANAPPEMVVSKPQAMHVEPLPKAAVEWGAPRLGLSLDAVSMATRPSGGPHVASVPLIPPPAASGSTTSLRRNLLAAFLALGACGLLALITWRLIETDRELARHLLTLANPQKQTTTPPATTEQPAAGALDQSQLGDVRPTQQPADAIVSSLPPSSQEDNSQRTAEVHDGAHAPFPLDSRLNSDGASPTASSVSAVDAIVQAPLDYQDIVAQIDDRLTDVWRELTLSPSPHLADPQRAQLVSLALTGQPATEPADNLETIISQATASLPFARQWANRFVSLWLSDADLPTADRAANQAAVQALTQHFADEIYQDRAWNGASLELIGGKLESGSPAANKIALTFVSALAGDGNHRLVERIGSSFLDVDLACVRCHEANSSLSTLEQSPQPLSVGSFAERQTVYWSLTAMLQGIETKSSTGEGRIVVDRQAELLQAGKPFTAFYDLLDGRLQAAEPRLPDGTAWDTVESAAVPRQALAEWLSQSAALDAATVNQVWKMLFGQQLVSQHPWQVQTPVELRAQSQRLELQQFLAGQYRAHGHSLKQLVGWIVRSDAFRRQPIYPTRNQWLAAPKEQLEHWQLAKANFASGATTGSMRSDSTLEGSLVAVLRWREKSGNGSVETTLAQPVPSPTTIPKREQSPASTDRDQRLAEDGQLSELLQLEFPPAADGALVDRLLATRNLSWENCVQHVAWLTPHNLSDSRIQFLANELLRQHNGDARATLLDLLWAVRH